MSSNPKMLSLIQHEKDKTYHKNTQSFPVVESNCPIQFNITKILITIAKLHLHIHWLLSLHNCHCLEQ